MIKEKKKVLEVYGMLSKDGQKPINIRDMNRAIARYIKSKHLK